MIATPPGRIPLEHVGGAARTSRTLTATARRHEHVRSPGVVAGVVPAAAAAVSAAAASAAEMPISGRPECSGLLARASRPAPRLPAKSK